MNMMEDNTSMIFNQLPISLEDMDMKEIKPVAALKLLPYFFLKQHCIFPVEEDKMTITFLSKDPLNFSAFDEVKLILDKEVKIKAASAERIFELISNFYNKNQGEASQFIADLQEEENLQGEAFSREGDLLDIQDVSPTVRLLNLILKEAIIERASDIHFESTGDALRVRYRIDGVLHNRHAPSLDYQAALLTRIKVMAKLNVAEHRLPQDGRIKLKMGGRDIDFRVSIVPNVSGERIVLRILDKENIILGLDQLGMDIGVLKQFKKLLKCSEGIILVTGPTGSGKTTTLYSSLCDIVSDSLNIMTIEDPVEYKVNGVAQMAVHPKIGLTFSTGLRHLLRQDPDILMVGEIRDKETAEIAIQAALTGHLVLSTLHTNDAPSTILRLIDMGIEPYLLSSTIIGVLAQRLVRKICPNCKKKVIPTVEEKDFLDKCNNQLSFLYEGSGCPDCLFSGYKYRHGIYELLIVDSDLKTVISSSKDIKLLQKTAEKRNFKNLLQHGLELVAQGTTTLSEVLRVISKID